MSTTSYAQYTKLRDGSWGLRAPGQVAEGSIVTVRKRDGETKVERVARVLWTGKDKDGTLVSLCAINQTSRSSNGSDRSEMCADCGQSRGVVMCQDSSGISGMCCRKCASYSRFDRSFA